MKPMKTPIITTPSAVSPPTLTVPNYITKEALKDFSIPPYTATTPLQNLLSPVIHPITVEIVSNYKNWQTIQQQENFLQQHL